MKKTFFAVMAALGIAFMTGCKTQDPTVDTMYSTSLPIGYTTGVVLNQFDISDNVRNKIVEIVGIVSQAVPGTNDTFEAKWVPIAQDHVNKLIEKGDVTEKEGELIVSGLRLVAKGIDYVFIRYPKAKAYQELTCAAIDGFTTGFLTTFKPVNTVHDEAARKAAAIDVDAYNYLKSQIK